MATKPIGNEEQMAQVKALMQAQEAANEVSQGDKAKNTVSINYTSDEGNLYEGKIIFKRPNVMETLKMGGRKTQILQQSGVVDRELADDGIMQMATMIATLETVVEKCPEWFIDIEAITDADIIYHVYGEYLLWDFSFRKAGKGTEDGDSKATAGEKAVVPS